MFLFSSAKPIQDYTHKLEVLVRGKLWLQALIALVVGIAVGLLLGPDFDLMPQEHVPLITAWLALPGELFLRLIKMILLPLLVASIIRGLGGAPDIDKLKKLGTKFVIYILCTTSLAIFIGITAASIIKPGNYVSLGENVAVQTVVPSILAEKDSRPLFEKLPTTLIELIPANPLASAINGEMLGIVIFAIIIGIAFAMHRDKKIEALLEIMDAILSICMTIVKWAMMLVPLAVFGLMARMVAEVGVVTLLGMGVYVGTVIGGLLIMMAVYCILVMIFGRINPLTFLRKIGSVQLLAFSTSSSAAVMPLSIQTAEEELDVERESAEVIIPLGATVNMDGTALYQSVAILFLAQMSGIDLALSQMLLITVTLVASSIGAPATPGVGMVILGSVAANIGIPTEGLVLILGVDRILDMCRTALNVTGDLTACVIFGEKEKLNFFGRIKSALT